MPQLAIDTLGEDLIRDICFLGKRRHCFGSQAPKSMQNILRTLRRSLFVPPNDTRQLSSQTAAPGTAPVGIAEIHKARPRAESCRQSRNIFRNALVSCHMNLLCTDKSSAPVRPQRPEQIRTLETPLLPLVRSSPGTNDP